MVPFRALTGLVVLLGLFGPHAHGGTVKDICRIKGQGESVLVGVGLVVGLPGTGDDAKDLATARPLMELLKNTGAAIDTPRSIEKSKSVALVSVSCPIPRQGARTDDTLDVFVTSLNTCKSLKGGRLFLGPLTGPHKGSAVYAMAEGPVVVEGGVETHGRIAGGARMTADVLMPEVGDAFELILDRPFEGWGAASQVAIAVNAKAQPGGPAVAKAIDDRTIRVTIPQAERADRAGFIADVLDADVSLAQVSDQARVLYNARTGAIIATGDVEIGPVAITHGNLTITTVTPAPQPTPQNPQVRQDRWTGLDTGARASEKARLSDLLAAFKQLDIPAQEQIGVLQMLHRIGKLQAKVEEF
jgi:flagellar P-ring protein FlgI